MDLDWYKKLKKLILDIPEDRTIYVVGHENADMDSIGSSLGLTRFLNKLGKKAYMLLEDKEFSKLEWFEEYEYIISKVEANEYVLFLMDCDEKSRSGIFAPYFDSAKDTILIDHHEGNKGQANHAFIMPDASSTCEVLYQLFCVFETKIDKKIAELLYAGIMTDTYCFSRGLTSNTLAITSNLLNYGINYNLIIKRTYLDKTKEEIKQLGKILESIEKYDNFHYVVINKKEEIFKQVEYNSVSKKFDPIMTNIEGIEVLVILILEENFILCEYRSNSHIDVDKLAISLGGGGHKKRSGFNSSEYTAAQILEITKRYIANYDEKQNEEDS